MAQGYRNGEEYKFERQFEINGRLLGILWSVGIDNGDHILLSYRYKYILEEISKKLGNSCKIWKAQSRTGVQY